MDALFAQSAERALEKGDKASSVLRIEDLVEQAVEIACDWSTGKFAVSDKPTKFA